MPLGGGVQILLLENPLTIGETAGLILHADGDIGFTGKRRSQAKDGIQIATAIRDRFTKGVVAVFAVCLSADQECVILAEIVSGEHKGISPDSSTPFEACFGHIIRGDAQSLAWSEGIGLV